MTTGRVNLVVGATAQIQWVAERRWCTQRGQYHIFSTPSLVQLAERAAMQVLAPMLGEDQISVGSSVNIRHLAPTLEGMSVRAVAKVVEIEEARVAFEIEIFDDLDKVGEARHERFVLEMGRYVRRLEKKRDAVAELASAAATVQVQA